MSTTTANEPTKHRIILDFEDTETLKQALEYIGESDAPVMITRGVVESDGRSFQLWDAFDDASNHCGKQL